MRVSHLSMTFIISALFVTCAQSDEPAGVDTNTPEAAAFSVDASLLGSEYTVDAFGLSLRPPVDWDRLAESERDALATALTARQAESDIKLAVLDLFLHAETFSYLSVSAVEIDGEPLTEVEPYAILLRNQIDTRDEEIASASVFLINGISVEQFRFLENERVNFVLLLEPTQEGVLQLDYSVPVDRFEQEVRKLESSIGSIRPQ